MTGVRAECLPIGSVNAPRKLYITFHLPRTSAGGLIQQWREKKKRFSTSKAAEVLHLEARAKQGTLQQLCCQNDLQPSRRGFYLLHSSSNLTHDFSTPVFYRCGIQNVITPTRGAISPSPLLQCSNDRGILCAHWHPGITHANSHSHSA